MITSPNEIPDCAIWLDAADLSTMYQEISVTTNARQNIYAPSDTFWSSNYAGTSNLTYNTSSFNTTTPYGTTYAPWLYETNTGINATTHSLTLNIDVPVAGTYTVSIYAKTSETRNQVRIDFDTANVIATLQGAGAIASSTGTTASGVILSTGGWYRVWFTRVVAAAGQKTFTIYTAQNNSSSTVNNSSTAKPGILAGGLMIERASGSPGTYIKSLHGFGLEGTEHVFPYIQPDRTTPVTRGNQSVAYWSNKSLSAVFYGISGFHTNCFNSYTKPILNSVWAGSLSALTFTTAWGTGRRYLTGFAQTGSFSVSAQTIFVVARNTNSSINSNTYNNSYDAHNTDRVSDWSNNINQQGATQTLFTQTLTGIADNNATNARTLIYDNSTGSSGVGNNNISTFVGVSSYGILVDSHTSMYANWLFGQQASPLQNSHPVSRNFIVTHTRNNGVINNYFFSLPQSFNYSRVYAAADYWGYNSWYTIPSVSGIPLSTNNTVNIFRIGSGITSWLDMNRFWGGVIAEVIVYQRCLSEEERLDVEYYLSRKWFPTGPRTVYALSSVTLDNSLGFSMSGEPTPWNTLLSSDIVFTNSYFLTANSNITLQGITNQRTSQFLSGGNLTLLNGVTYKGDVYGGIRPYAVTLEPNSTCTILGNIYGGGYYTNSFNGVGVDVPSTCTLNHTGTVNGGMDDGTHGIVCTGILNASGPIYGSGIGRTNIQYKMLGSTLSYGVLLKDTTFTFPKTYNGMCGAGVGLIRSEGKILNQTVHCIIDWVNSNGDRTSSDVNGRTCVICALSCQNSSLTALNTQFFGTTSTVMNHNTGSVIFSRTCVLTLSSKGYFENCTFTGENQRQYNGRTDYELNHVKGTVITTDSSSLTGVNCIIKGSPDTYYRNIVTFTEERWARPGLNVRGTTTATLINCRVNPSPGNFNTGIINTGTIWLSGHIRGGNRLPGNVVYQGIHNCGTLYAEGVVQPNYSGAEGINNQADGTMQFRGIIRPAGPLRPTITSQGALTAFYSAPLESSLQGCPPIAAEKCIYVSLCSTSLYSTFSVNGLNEMVIYRDEDYQLNQPDPSDVLLGVKYSPFDALTGTVIIPAVNETIIGVPVQSIYGTRKPLTVDAFWNQPITVVPQLSTTVYKKLINPVTSNALSALVLSLDYPSPQAP